MDAGEHRFKNVKYIDINKSFLEDKLYASAIYVLEDRFILEILVPKDIFNNDFSVDYEKYHEGTIGEQWAIDMNKNAYPKNPLEHSNYYIEMNGFKLGDGTMATYFRYEPVSCEEVQIDISLEDEITENNKDIPIKEMLGTMEEHITSLNSTLEGDLNTLFQDEELKNTVVSLIASLPAINLDNPEESSLKFQKERERREKAFFNKFRNKVEIPDHLKNEPMAIVDLIFKSKDKTLLKDEIKSLKFIYKNYSKCYLTRLNFQLPFGKSNEAVKNDSEIWGDFAKKIFIEDIIECKREDEPIMNFIQDRMPQGKKAIYITYEILDNVLLTPHFYTKELLNSQDFSQVIFTKSLLLKDKGIKGFNKYIDFVGYIDENKDLVDFELFQLVATFTRNEEIALI